MDSSARISPFKFLDSYSKSDKDIFFGRNREVSEVHSKIYQSKLLLVYGASGTGKSSIINCGLANQLSDTDWLPVNVRRGGDMGNSMLKQLSKQTAVDLELENEESELDFHKNLHNVVSNVFLDHFKPIYLIFDQFEELFIFGFKDEWLRFIRGVRYLMDTDLDIHFIFVIRGEYLEFLSEFEELIPEFFDNRVRIEKMTRAMAKESITGPSNLASIKLDNGFEENLLKKLSPDKSQIELTFLQVILDKLYRSAESRSENNEALALTNQDIDSVGQIGDILAEFVDEQLFKMPDSKAALTVLKGFVSLEGTKTQRTVKEVKSHSDDIGQPIEETVVESIISSFVNKRILKDKDDNNRYELRHDSLAQKIFEKITNQEKELLEVRRFIAYNFEEYQKRKSILTDDDLSYLAPYERLLNLTEAQKQYVELSKKRSSKRRKAQRTRTIIISVITVLFITSVIGFVISQQQRQRAEQLAEIASDESEKAKSAQLVAEKQSQLAAQNAEEAQRQASIAALEANNALIARDQAESQEAEAIKQKIMADNSRSVAEQAQLIAVANEQEANVQRANAEERRLEAEILRMQSLSRELALKSIYMVDPESKALIAKLAFSLSAEYGGNSFSTNIYRGLYLSNRTLSGRDFNSYEFTNKEIIGIVKSSQNQFVATSDGLVYKLDWDGYKLAPKELISSELRISSIDMLNSNEIAIGDRNGTLSIIDPTGQIISSFNQTEVSPIVKTISNKDGNLIVAMKNGTIKILNREGSPIHEDDLMQRINDCIQLSDNRLLVATTQGWLVTMDENLEPIRTIQTKINQSINKILQLNEQEEIIIGSNSGQVFRFNISTEEIFSNLIGHTAGITDMELSVSGKFLITSSNDRSVRLWNLENSGSQSILLSEHELWATGVGIDIDEKYAYSTSYNGKVRKYPLDINELEKPLCSLISRTLTRDEWSEYVGSTIDYMELCK